MCALYLELSKMCFFTVYNKTTRLPIYTRYNFDFVNYKIYSNLSSNFSNILTFNKFLIENETNYSKPLTVKPNLVKFFKPITPKIISYLRNYGYTIHGGYPMFYLPSSYISPTVLIETQFIIDNTTYYDDSQIRFIQDFHIEDKFEKMFTKYNFDFDKFSLDFNVWGSKLQIFTDFISRCIKLGSGIIWAWGYLLPEEFKKYFLDIPGLKDYIINYGITSNLLDTYKNPNMIDWASYAQLNNFNPKTDITILKSHFYCIGQFEQRKFKFIVKPLTNIQKIGNSVCSIYSVNNYGNDNIYNGFLYKRAGLNNDNTFNNKIYLVTTYNVIKNKENTSTLRASFSIDNNDKLSEPITITAEFDIIGYDPIANILVAEFNPKAYYNIVNNVNLSSYQLISISPDYNINYDEDVFLVGNLDNISLKSLFTGRVVNTTYNGDFSSDLFLTEADKMIIDIPNINNCTGSPVFVCNNISSSDNNYTCVGMIASYQNENTTPFHKKVIKNNFLFIVVQSILGTRDVALSNPRLANNSILLYYYSRLSIQKTWLGTIMRYYNAATSSNIHPTLINFPYTGGIVIEKFIFGLNITTQKFTTDIKDLGKFDIVTLNTPLLNTKMYNRYIDSSNSPIVIKSITYYQKLQAEYKTFYFGKYGNQESFCKFTYGFLPIYNKITNKSFTLTEAYYNTIKVDFFYYDGSTWIEDSEEIGGNDSSWFNSLTDSLGNIHRQHKFQFPFPLLSYFNTNDIHDMISEDNNRSDVDTWDANNPDPELNQHHRAEQGYQPGKGLLYWLPSGDQQINNG